ncbi:UNVERIFIED_CONTAM: hypothetical protein GTU68_024970 [Idotea baltica]|nr:hypothetical protein [Idotea baltica]
MPLNLGTLIANPFLCRRKIIKHINYDLHQELDFCREMIEFNPKNYQVWHHRRVIVEWLGDPSKELRLTTIIFALDAKNYHAWEHRQWVLSTFNLFGEEMQYVEYLIEEDIRNNSAWNQRFFTVSMTTGFSDDVIEREVSFARRAIDKLVNNESPWNFLKGVVSQSTKRLSEFEDIEKWCWDLYKAGGHSCPYVVTFLIDLLEDKLEASPEKREDVLKQAVKVSPL